MYLSRFFAFSALPFVAQTISTVQPPTSRGVTIPLAKRMHSSVELANAVKSSVSKIQRGMAAYQINTGEVHPLSGGIKTSVKRDSGSFDLDRFYRATAPVNLVYYFMAAIGNPPVNITLQVDTAGSDTIVASVDCVDEVCSGHHKYDPTLSDSSTIINPDYDEGIWKGSLIEDVVSIANLSVKKQRFLAGTDFPGGYAIDITPQDGVIGLAFPELSLIHVSPFLEHLASERQLDTSGFALNLTKTGGELYIGVIPNAAEMIWIAVSKGGFWIVPLTGIQVGDNEMIPLRTPAILDTSAPMIFGDHLTISRVFAQIPHHVRISTHFFGIPCINIPDIYLYLDHKKMKISRDAFNLGPANDTEHPDICIPGASANVKGRLEAWLIGLPAFVGRETGWNFTKPQPAFGFREVADTPIGV